jgi:hypothetical protein
MSTSTTTRNRPVTTAEKLTAAVNQSLGERGCSYCRLFKPFDQVRTVRTRLGVPRAICDTCQQNRKGNPK